MTRRNRTASRVLGLGLLAALAAGTAPAPARAADARTFSAGLVWEHFSRTVVWDGDEAASAIRSHSVSARAVIGTAKGWAFSLSVGMSFSSFPDMTFDGLPISLQFESATLGGLLLGAGVSAPVARSGAIEIGAAARIVYSMGLTKSWTLEGFAVEGRAEGRPDWMELAVGPRVTVVSLGRVRPYLEATARWLRADFRMTEVLGDLEGEELKRVGGDLAVGLAVGADAMLTDHVALVAKAGVMPRAGGLDGLAAAGLLYRF